MRSRGKKCYLSQSNIFLFFYPDSFHDTFRNTDPSALESEELASDGIIMDLSYSLERSVVFFCLTKETLQETRSGTITTLDFLTDYVIMIVVRCHRRLTNISKSNSMICSDIWHKYHE